MQDFIKLVAAADSVDALRAILAAAEADDLAQLGAVVRRSQEPPPAAAYAIPGPYDIAMQFGAALASSGLYTTPGAAMAAAWMAVPEFYMARDTYLRDLAPMFAGLSGAESDAETPAV